MSALDQWGPPVICRHSGFKPVAAAIGGLLGFGWWYGETHPDKPAHHPAPAAPKPQVIVHQVTTYLPAPHPWISGSEVVWIVVVIAVAVIALGLAWLRRP